MIKNVVFDMGKVLLNFDPDHFILREGVDDSSEREHLRNIIFNRPEWCFLDWGDMDEEGYLEECVLPDLEEKYHSLARKLVKHWDEPIIPIEGMAEVVRWCRSKGLNIYLLSNASSRLHEYFPRVPGSECFLGKVVSADVHLVKPQPEIYQYLLKKFSLKAKECIFIDDNMLNITASLKEGFHGFFFRGDVKALRAWIEKELDK
ncbi:MAG: HAD family phosphatase [Sphaerochaetaceae bacterium]|nr:HAD family phosphatase [Sphaerochaetaceae bacterium]